MVAAARLLIALVQSSITSDGIGLLGVFRDQCQQLKEIDKGVKIKVKENLL